MKIRKRIIIDSLKFVGIPFIFYIILDYVNIPTILGIKMNNISYDLLSTFIDISVLILLYIVSYRIIDKRQINKDENAKQTANILIKASYDKCLRYLNIIDNQQLLEQYVIPKIDFDEAQRDSSVAKNFQDNPFEEYASILSLAENGFVEKKDLLTYLEVEDLYKGYISNRITFFDIDKEARTSEQLEMRAIIEKNRSDLYNKLEEETKKLDESIGRK